MPRLPYNSVGGFSTGLTLTNVIDDIGNITGVGATFSGLIRANAGISASGATFSGNISAPNIVTSVNGATGSVTTYAGTTGNIQVRYGSGITATNYFGLAQGEVGEITDILTLSGTTVGFSPNLVGNNETLGLEFSRGYGGSLNLDEGGGVAISAKGIWDDGGFLYGANLYLRTPASDSGSSIIFRLGDDFPFTVQTTSVASNSLHYFYNGLNAPSADYTNNFAGPITGVTATFTGLLSASKGISASGITVGGSIVLQNQEFIRNTTNGRMDFMPAPAGSTHFGMYMDFTSWGYGVKLGTIRASDSALNAAGFLWDAPLTISSDISFSLGSDGQNGFRNSTVGNRTNHFFTNTTSGANSGAFAFIDSAGVGAPNRSPGVTHANPNLYVYRSGSASANDFVRMEHDGTVGRIVSGGTSGILLQPGSGVLAISGGISASGGITLNGYLTGSTGFLFGPTSAFLQFVPTTPNSGGLLLRNGIFQVGNNPIAYGSGFLNVDPNAERMVFNGRTEMYINNAYQAAASAYSIAIGTSHVGDPIRISKQTTFNSIDATKLIAGCNVNGVWYGAGFSGGTAGVTFGSNVQANGYILTSNARSWFL